MVTAVARVERASRQCFNFVVPLAICVRPHRALCPCLCWVARRTFDLESLWWQWVARSPCKTLWPPASSAPHSAVAMSLASRIQTWSTFRPTPLSMYFYVATHFLIDVRSLCTITFFFHIAECLMLHCKQLNIFCSLQYGNSGGPLVNLVSVAFIHNPENILPE